MQIQERVRAGGDQMHPQTNIICRELETRLGNTFWVSPDVGTNHDIIVPAGGELTYVGIMLAPQTLSFFGGQNQNAIACAFATTRSRFAQIGLEVAEHAAEEIAKTLSLEKLPNGNEQFTATVPVSNWSERPIFMPEGTKFFQMYEWNRQTILGHELLELIGDKVIQISGNEGETWRPWYDPNSDKNMMDIKGIEFFIDENTRSYIPESDEPMQLSDAPAANHNRSQVDRYLRQPIPLQKDPMLVIAETLADIKLAPSINGIVDTGISHSGLPVGQLEVNGFHTNSLLVLGGNTYGRLRTETFSPTLEKHLPQTILMRFARNGNY